jgi:diaminohydroxyphosphoribosylaminopyrimidine deaminase/5-amino-6-(5-phosphoribosylamino)uracil reductase
METSEKKFMLLALKLAQKGTGSVEPNPAVGCVIVKNGRIIGQGWHKKFGGPHAEINALLDCVKKGIDPAGSTMYVTLEPCRHFGKTPPCTDAIIKAKISKVVAAAIDSSKHSNGKGLKQLKKAGIKVRTGLCENEVKVLNAPFFKFAVTGKPWIILKWAQSADGFMASKKGRWISNEKSRRNSQRLRRRADAILVGINTVVIDDPLLTARPPAKHKKLLRIVLDSFLKIPLNSKLVRTIDKSPLLIFTTKPDKKKLILEKKGAEIIKTGGTNGKCNLKDIINKLSKRGIQQLLVEGGQKTITEFLKQKLADEIIVYTSGKKLGKNGSVQTSQSMKKVYRHLKNHYSNKKLLGTDVRLTAFLGKI